VVNLAREHTNYDEEIKLSIYKKLNRQPFRFNELVEELARNRVTVSEYLLHAQNGNEIEKDLRTKEYYLTEKGKDEVDRILADRARKLAPFRYHGRVGPSSGGLVEWKAWFPAPRKWSEDTGVHSDQDYDMAVSISGSQRYGVVAPRLPLPLDLDASMYGSEEFRGRYDEEERFFQDDMGLRPKAMRATVLDETVRPLAEGFFWSFLMLRFTDFLRWHEMSREKRTTEAPPPLTVESILDFDVSMTIRYQGKDRFLRRGVPTASEAKERHLIMKRLVGALLLRAAYNWNLELGFPYVDLLRTAGWLDKGDADALNAAYIEWKKGPDREPLPDNPLRVLLYQTGWRYLEEGGYPKVDVPPSHGHV
jgi:hypothetical protein